MSAIQKRIIVVEDDPFLRLVQVILDPATPAERTAAFAHFMAHDEPDFGGWCDRLRTRLRTLYPAAVRLVEDESQLHAHLPGAEIAVVEAFRIGPGELAAAGGTLDIIQKYGTITSVIDTAACGRAGVRVLTIRRRANIATAEHAFALLLALARKVPATANRISEKQLETAGFSPTVFARAHTPNGNWARIPQLQTLYGKQMGIVGLGEVGREVALRASAFGMRIVYTQRHRLSADEERRYGAAYCTLAELLATSDVVSLHLPGGAATRGFLGRHELALTKPGALVINVAQPQLIDRNAIAEALAAGRVRGFGLDTFYEEPGEEGDALLRLPNVIVTAHLGGSPRFNALEDFTEMLLQLDQALP
jgi:glyoxylate reductase/D-3-phosphoglycerate dehydrogenase